MSSPLGPLSISPLFGNEPFHNAQKPLGFTVASFWRWAASDLASNVWRGVLAEFLVAQALGSAAGVRTEWDACDVRTTAGLRVEVKSAAYLQSWHQRALSAISFDIAMKRAWDAQTNTSASVPCRSADVYVFALLAHRDKATLDPLDVSQWEFYVVSARRLDATLGTAKSMGLSALRRIALSSVPFADLPTAVAAASSTTEVTFNRADQQ
jgi:hypothetical protein